MHAVYGMDLANVSAFATIETLRAATEHLALADPSASGSAAAAAAAVLVRSMYIAMRCNLFSA
jgi:hypothetical protein